MDRNSRRFFHIDFKKYQNEEAGLRIRVTKSAFSNSAKLKNKDSLLSERTNWSQERMCRILATLLTRVVWLFDM